METDEEVEEIVEKEVVKDVVHEIKVPQVKALHPFSGQGLKMAKGEVGGVIKLNGKPGENLVRNPTRVKTALRL